MKLILDTICTGSLAEECSPPIYFWPNFLYMCRDKVYSNEHSHWFKLHMASAVYLERGRGGGGRGVGGGKEHSVKCYAYRRQGTLCHTFRMLLHGGFL